MSTKNSLDYFHELNINYVTSQSYKSAVKWNWNLQLIAD